MQEKVTDILKRNAFSKKLLSISTLTTDLDAKLFPNAVNRFDEDISYLGPDSYTTGGTTQQWDNKMLELAAYTEISDVLDKMVEEIIVFKTNDGYCAELITDALDKSNYKDEIKTQLKDLLQAAFKMTYSKLKFKHKFLNDQADIHKIIKLFLTLGRAQWFIDWDDPANPKVIKAIYYLDPRKYIVTKRKRTTKEGIMYVYVVTRNNSCDLEDDSMFGSNYTQYIPTVLLDSQLVDIRWHHIDINANRSYVATLERSFQVMRLMERAHIAWAFMNSQFRTLYIVPIKGKGRIRGREVLNKTVAKYKQDVTFDDITGEVKTNGEVIHKFNRELWLTESTSGTPSVENLGGNGPDFSDMSQLQEFKSKFYKDSKIPSTRFDIDNPQFWSNDPTQISIIERQFNNYITRIQQVVVHCLYKPMNLQLKTAGFDIDRDNEIAEMYQINMFRNNDFARQLELTMLEQNATAIDGLKNALTTIMPDGSEKKGLSMKLLMKKFLTMSPEDIKLNEEWLAEEDKATLDWQIKQKKALDDAGLSDDIEL